MTDEERTNRNPAPELHTLNLADAPELFIKDLEINRVYILHQTHAATLNYVGRRGLAYHFYGPRAEVHALLIERPDNSGTLEDGRGVKVTIRKYTGPDA